MLTWHADLRMVHLPWSGLTVEAAGLPVSVRGVWSWKCHSWDHSNLHPTSCRPGECSGHRFVLFRCRCRFYRTSGRCFFQHVHNDEDNVFDFTDWTLQHPGGASKIKQTLVWRSGRDAVLKDIGFAVLVGDRNYAYELTACCCLKPS